MTYRRESVDVQGHPMPVLVFDAAGPGPHPGLVIAQHLPNAHAGLETDPFQLDVGERYARAGYTCAMPYVFHWWRPEVARDVKVAEFRDERTLADLGAAFDLLARSDGVDARRIGIVGHCWGGRIAWLGAAGDRRYRACALFYGGRIKVPFGDAPAPIDLAPEIACPVLGVFGNDDLSPSAADVDDYAAALHAAGVPHEFHRYEGAGHGFQDFNMPEGYREAQSEDAWAKAIEFFERHLRAGGTGPD